MAYQSHKPFISHDEYATIQTIAQEIPHDTTVVTLTGAYMSWMSDDYDREIYSLYQGVSSKVWSREEKARMRYDKEFLCEKLDDFPGEVFVYLGSKEIFTSPRDNSCLEVLQKWSHGGQLLRYTSISER